MEKVLSSLYYDPGSPAAFSGVNVLHREARKVLPNISQREVAHWLAKEYTYSLHKPIRRRFPHTRYIFHDIDEQWQIDLADMASIAEHNDDYRFILTCVDGFSKYAWAEPVKRKSDTTEAFERILSSGRKPKKVLSDRGKEFLNSRFQGLLRREGIRYYNCNNPDIKCSLVERFNRTLKTKIWKYFTKTRNYRYIDHLQDFVDGYNRTKHRTIGVAPVDAGEHVTAIREKFWEGPPQPSPLAPGDYVRISKTKGTFEKGYLPNWSEEVFRVKRKFPKFRMYELEDLAGEEVKGLFYRQEVQKVEKPETYWVEKVIKTRKRRGKKEYFVKWVGYPEKFNSWISEDDGLLPVHTQ